MGVNKVGGNWFTSQAQAAKTQAEKLKAKAESEQSVLSNETAYANTSAASSDSIEFTGEAKALNELDKIIKSSVKEITAEARAPISPERLAALKEAYAGDNVPVSMTAVAEAMLYAQ